MRRALSGAERPGWIGIRPAPRLFTQAEFGVSRNSGAIDRRDMPILLPRLLGKPTTELPPVFLDSDLSNRRQSG